MDKDRIIKKLIEQAKKYGYLTHDDIIRTFDDYDIAREEVDSFIEMLSDIGVKIIETKDTERIIKDIVYDEEMPQQEPMQIFLREFSKIESIDRETEVKIAKDMRKKESELLYIVLSSPIALRELNNWVSLIKRNEMTPKELMKRGRKTKRSVQKMRRKLISAFKVVNKLRKKLVEIREKLRNKKISVKLKDKYNKQLHNVGMKIVNKIMQLNLNSEKIKRLIKKTLNITEKAIQVINEKRKYEQLFSVDYDTLSKLIKKVKEGKISPVEFKRIVGFSVTAAQTMYGNFQKVMAEYEKQVKELDMWEDEIVYLNTRIKTLLNEIENDKMKLVQANLDIVVNFAKKVSILTGADIDDLIQEGATGLKKAAEKFEWQKGYKFSTYAHWWVRQAVSRYMAEYTKTIRLPVHIRELVSKMIKVFRRHQHISDREITIHDYTRLLKVSPKKIIDTLTVLPEPISSLAPKGPDEETTVQDYIPAPEKELPLNSLLQSYRREVLEEAMNKFLDEREREILKMRIGWDGKEYTLEEVGKKFKITRERVRQIEAKAIRKLRSPEALEKLREIYPIR